MVTSALTLKVKTEFILGYSYLSRYTETCHTAGRTDISQDWSGSCSISAATFGSIYARKLTVSMLPAWVGGRVLLLGIWSPGENWPAPEHLSMTTWKLISVYTIEEHTCLERDCWQTARSLQAEHYPRELILPQEEKCCRFSRFTFCMHLQKPGSIQQESKAIATHDVRTSAGLPKSTAERELPIIQTD